MREQVISQVSKKSFMGMELEGFVKHAVSLNSGMIHGFHKEVRRGRKVVGGDLAFYVCSQSVADEAVDGGDRVDLDNGLAVIFQD